MSIKVYSEIGKLKKVVLHRPGEEVENIIPETFEELLFDDSMFLEVARQEHDEFANTLRAKGVEVFYIEQLTADVLDMGTDIKDAFIERFVEESECKDKEVKIKTKLFLKNIKDTKEMVDKTIAGIRYKELGLSEEGLGINVFVTNPLPNVLFTRDNWASVGSGVTLNRMFSPTRNRELIYGEFVFAHNKDLKDSTRYFKHEWTDKGHIEGGDELIINDNVIAIGISLRTSREAVMEVAKNVFEDENETFTEVYGFHIPSGRAWMHLDTVFTMVDKDKFSIYTNRSFEIEKFTSDGKGGLIVEKLDKDIKSILEEIVGREVTLIQCGKGDVIDGNREQWNDGSNSLAISPNEIIAYSRNHVTIGEMKKAGVKVNIIPSSELSRGRGGPRCMSMPLEREEVDWKK